MSIELIKALRNPTLYDHPTEVFRVLETHISWIVLTGQYAYKIKKPVDFGFLDFSSLEKRKHFCEEELRLNRRLAPELYLDIVAISGSHENLILNNNRNDNKHNDSTLPVIDYAVKMVQFPQTGLLDRLQEEHRLSPHHINELSRSIADFHLSIDIASPGTPYGSSNAVFSPVEQNFQQIDSRLFHPNLRESLAQLRAWAKSTYSRLLPLFEERKKRGFIRECHGDLHLGNITEYKNKLVIFDCIEFNPDLRWVDVISDLAFLAMDLESRGESAYGNQLINQYLEHTGDYEGAALIYFYKAYRAMVRAKVTVLSLQTDQGENAVHHNSALMKVYHQYTGLADRYESIPYRYVIVMHGYSGSGKSTISEQLVAQLGAIRVRSDIERKRLLGLEAKHRSESDINSGIYDEAMTERTYQHLAKLGGVILDGGFPVIIDATNLKASQRALFQEMAELHAVPLLIVSCYAEKKELEKRVSERRARQNDASDADIKILQLQQQSADKLSDNELDHTLPILTGKQEQLTSLIKEIKNHFGVL